LYLTSDGQWGAKVNAREFADVEAAGQEAFRFEDAHVVLSYDEPHCELALNPAYCARRPPRPRKPGGKESPGK
jgi:hypothetical protein